MEKLRKAAYIKSSTPQAVEQESHTYFRCNLVDCPVYNQKMDFARHLKLVAISLAFSLAMGCAPIPHSPLVLPPPNLVPYPTATRSVSPSAIVSSTEIPIPTPTPSSYIVAAGDSLSTIAEQFGLRLEDLQIANPGVISENLSIGQMLKIPGDSPTLPGSSLPTPAPVQLGAVRCYPSGAGAYCLATLHNPFPEALENIKLQFSLLDSNGQPLTSLEGFLPINILPPASALPAYAFFPAGGGQAAQTALAPGTQLSAQLAASIRLAPGDQRYLTAVARNILTNLAWNSRSARVQGQIFLPSNVKTDARVIWLVAVAYDEDGQPVGFRRWEWQGRLKPGEVQPFDLFIYSLGPAIERIDVIIEARP